MKTLLNNELLSSSLNFIFVHHLGKKLLGPGARVNLPTSEEVDNELGLDLTSIAESLEGKVKKMCI